MRVRLSIVLLLIIATMTMAAAAVSVSHPRIIRDDPPAQQQETKLTPEEAAEALALALRFQERWRETVDFGLVMEEVFIKDFSERLWQVPQEELPWILIDKNLIVHASPQELRRYYVATMNFYGLYSKLYEVADRLHEESENKDDSLKMSDVLSPEVVNVLLGNRTFAKLAKTDKEEGSDERAKEDDHRQPAETGDSAQAAPTTAEASGDESTEEDEIGIIKTLPQLNDASATLEKARDLMRKRLADLSRKAQATSESGDEESKVGSQTPVLSSLDEEEYGYPKDTPIIHLDAARFRLHLIKIEGRFRILSASIYVD